MQVSAFRSEVVGVTIDEAMRAALAPQAALAGHAQYASRALVEPQRSLA